MTLQAHGAKPSATRVGHCICAEAEALHASCVVVAAHSRGRIRELFVGSVTEYCVHNCSRPLVIVRPPMGDARLPSEVVSRAAAAEPAGPPLAAPTEPSSSAIIAQQEQTV